MATAEMQALLGAMNDLAVAEALVAELRQRRTNDLVHGWLAGQAVLLHNLLPGRTSKDFSTPGHPEGLDSGRMKRRLVSSCRARPASAAHQMQAEVVFQNSWNLDDAGQGDLQAALFHHVEAIEADIVVRFAAFGDVLQLAAQAHQHEEAEAFVERGAVAFVDNAGGARVSRRCSVLRC